MSLPTCNALALTFKASQVTNKNPSVRSIGIFTSGEIVRGGTTQITFGKGVPHTARFCSIINGSIQKPSIRRADRFSPRTMPTKCDHAGRSQPLARLEPDWKLRGALFSGKRPDGATKEALRAATMEQLRKHRAAGLLSVAGVGSFLTARCGDARNSPPWPQPKSLAAAPLVVSKQALTTEFGLVFGGGVREGRRKNAECRRSGGRRREVVYR